MRRIGLPLVLFALGAASCSGTEASSETIVSTTTIEGQVTTTSVPSPAPPSEESTTTAGAAPTEAPPTVDGPPAPDFTLALADGTDFVLSEEQKPVYMVFWAEW